MAETRIKPAPLSEQGKQAADLAGTLASLLPPYPAKPAPLSEQGKQAADLASTMISSLKKK